MVWGQMLPFENDEFPRSLWLKNWGFSWGENGKPLKVSELRKDVMRF